MASLTQTFASLAIAPKAAAAPKAIAAKVHFAGKSVKATSARLTFARRAQRLVVRADGEEAAPAPEAAGAPEAAEGDAPAPVRARGE